MQPEVIESIDQAIAQLERELIDLRQARTIMARIAATSAPSEPEAEAPAPARRRRVATVQAGPAAAILQYLASASEPIKFADVRKTLDLKPAEATKALATLIAAKQVVRAGWRVGTPATMAAADDAEGD
jgi:hypothetical protein